MPEIGREAVRLFGAGSEMRGFILLWMASVLGLFGLILAFLAKNLELQRSEAHWRRNQVHARAAAYATLQEAIAVLKGISEVSVNGADRGAQPGIYVYDPQSPQQKRWLRCPKDAEKTFGYYTIEAVAGLGQLRNPLNGGLKEPLAAYLAKMQPPVLEPLKPLTRLLEGQSLEEPLPLLVSFGVKGQPDALGKKCRFDFELVFLNPFDKRLSASCTLSAAFKAVFSAYAENRYLRSQDTPFEFEEPLRLRLCAGETLTLRFTETLTLTSGYEGEPTTHYELRLAGMHPDTQLTLTAEQATYQRSYALDELSLNKKFMRRLSINQPFDLGHWDWVLPKSLENRQPQQALLPIRQEMGAPSWKIPPALLLSPILKDLKHMGQLCRCLPGVSPADPTWLFGAPKPTAPGPAPAHLCGPGHLHLPDTVSLNIPQDLWDATFIPSCGSSDFYQAFPAKASDPPAAHWRVRNPINLNAANDESWKRVLEPLCTRELLGALGVAFSPEVVDTLSEALATPQQPVWTCVKDYVESGFFQKALDQAGLGALPQAHFLESLLPRLCVRSETFRIRVFDAAGVVVLEEDFGFEGCIGGWDGVMEVTHAP